VKTAAEGESGKIVAKDIYQNRTNAHTKAGL